MAFPNRANWHDSAEEVRLPTPALCLHVLPSFGIGGVPLRMARIITGIKSEFRHRIIALDGVIDAQSAIGQGVSCSVTPLQMPDRNLLSRMFFISSKLREFRPQLLVTYNWGSIEWAMANRLLVGLPHIHHEAGFGKDEAEQQLQRRIYFRRRALRNTRGIIVPSRTLERTAMDIWRLPKDRVMYIPNGIDEARFVDARTHRVTEPTPVTVASVAPLRPEKNISRLLHAFAFAHERIPLRLIIAGDGVERPRLEALARELKVDRYVQFLGTVAQPESILSKVDILALSSDTEQMPNSVLEAMASALPVASLDVGDVRVMLAAENTPFVVARNDNTALGVALITLARQAELRQKIGLANLARVRQEFSHKTMIDRWRSALSEVMEQPGSPQMIEQ